MGEDNSTPIIEDSTHAAGNGAGGKEGDVAVKEERRKHLLAFGVGMAIFVTAIVIGVFAMRACSDQHHSQYATGQEYTATGYVVDARAVAEEQGQGGIGGDGSFLEIPYTFTCTGVARL